MVFFLDFACDDWLTQHFSSLIRFLMNMCFGMNTRFYVRMSFVSVILNDLHYLRQTANVFFVSFELNRFLCP